MKAVVNGRFLSRRVTGVERYGQEILPWLEGSLRVVRPEIPLQEVRGHVWEQFILPGKIRPDETLWSPANTGPLVVSNQVLTLHDLSPLEHPEWFKPAFSAWYRLFLPILARRVKKVLTSSEYGRKKVLARFSLQADRVVCVPAGVDRDKFHPLAGPKEPYLLFVGTHEPRKNLSGLLRAWEMIKGKYPHFHLVVAGSMGSVFRKMHLSENLERVHFPGYIPESDLPSLYARAMLFVLPSYDEGFGLPLLEAMACGTAVIAAQAGALPEVAGDAGMLFVPAHDCSLAAAIDQCLSDPVLLGSLREKGLERAARFSWQASAEKSLAGTPGMSMTPKVALVVDALPGLGGSEKVSLAVAELFPAAPIYTLVYNRQAFAHTCLADHQVTTSFIDRLPFARTQYRKYLPLMPHAIEQFDLSAYDIILSFSYAVAHGVRTRPGQLHLSYTYTPMRYAWRGIRPDGTHGPAGRLVNLLFRSFRTWDVAAAARVDQFAAVSHWIGDWIRQVYGRAAKVIYPPVDIERFQPQPDRDEYFVALSRLVPHKRLDLIIEAFNGLKLPLLVIGEGPERRRLFRQACPNIRLMGFQNDDTVANLLSRARGFICATDEDFGIALVEAQASGCPVIAYGKGGVLETVLDGQTGLFFEDQSAESLIDAVERFERYSFDPRACVQNAARFSKAQFQEEFKRFVEQR